MVEITSTATLSELISNLQEMQREHGDLPVALGIEITGYATKVKTLSVKEINPYVGDDKEGNPIKSSESQKVVNIHTEFGAYGEQA